MGIIPAYAGSTVVVPHLRATLGDHPRIRGEHVLTHLHPGEIEGSSPHTRGAPIADAGLQGRDGIIPAYAGSTCISRRRDVRKWDHPRIRGEHQKGDLVAVSGQGSSPHTRGAPAGGVDDLRLSRIIPAYAGSTLLRWIWPSVK